MLATIDPTDMSTWTRENQTTWSAANETILQTESSLANDLKRRVPAGKGGSKVHKRLINWLKACRKVICPSF